MMKARHHWIIDPFFRWYALARVSRNFGPVDIDAAVDVRGHSVLLIANHISWWDGFWLMVFNLKVLHKRFHFMMLEKQLRKHWYFNWAGGFSVAPDSRSVLRSLDYAAGLLNDTNNLVVLFPQGRIGSLHDQQFVFARGVEYILDRQTGSCKVVMVANLVDYFSSPKPVLSIYAREASSGIADTNTLQQQYQQFYQQCVIRQKKKANQ